MKALEMKRLQKKQQRAKKILEAENSKLNASMREEERLMKIVQNLEEDTRSMKKRQKELNSKKTEIEREIRRDAGTYEQLLERGRALERDKK